MNTQLCNGTVKFFNKEKGFGFIKSDATGEIFFHKSGVIAERELREGDAVTFNTTEGKKGAMAVDVDLNLN